jgi:regulator of replication initiation timing
MTQPELSEEIAELRKEIQLLIREMNQMKLENNFLENKLTQALSR